ncbi:MAG TPA: hypothetical protein VM009_02815, partial [Terriglobales bacterium]|nr:hypothetical protein [Terriglobales bacterium]
SADAARQNAGGVLLSFLAMMGATWVFSIIMLCIHQISTDFAVPMMALERVSLREASRRVWNLASSNAGDFAIYLLLKVGLVIAASIALMIAEVAVLIVPLIGMVIILVMMAKSLIGNPVGLVVGMGSGLALCLLLLMFLVAMIAAPTYVFFQSYALEFFADRYPPLKALLYPPPPVSPEPEPPPLPAM